MKRKVYAMGLVFAGTAMVAADYSTIVQEGAKGAGAAAAGIGMGLIHGIGLVPLGILMGIIGFAWFIYEQKVDQEKKGWGKLAMAIILGASLGIFVNFFLLRAVGTMFFDDATCGTQIFTAYWKDAAKTGASAATATTYNFGQGIAGLGCLN